MELKIGRGKAGKSKLKAGTSVLIPKKTRPASLALDTRPFESDADDEEHAVGGSENEAGGAGPAGSPKSKRTLTSRSVGVF